MPPKWHGNVLLAQGFAARPGIYEYKNADGTITRELIRPETLARSVRGLARCPVTLEHPKEDADAENHQRLNVGDVDGGIEVDDDGYIRVKIAIRRKDAQTAVLNKRHHQLSPGYMAKIDKTPGTHEEYGRYDAEQVDRNYNHLALVQDARGGDRIAIRTDSDEPWAEMADTIRGDASEQPPNEGVTMPPRLVRMLTLLGFDAHRVDSEDVGWQLVEHAAMRRAGMGARRDMAPGMMDNEQMGYPDGDPGEGESDDTYYDDEGNATEYTKDEVISALRDENEKMREMLGESADEEAMEDMDPLAEESGMDEEEMEEAKADGAVGYALHIVNRFRRDSGVDPIDVNTTTLDELWGQVQMLQAMRGPRQDGAQPKPRRGRRADSGGRTRGSQVWEQSPRNDAADFDNVYRFDAANAGPSQIASMQYASQRRRS